jgi:hypothetical protein
MYRSGNFTPKRVAEVEVYSVDFSSRLLIGENILTAIWTNSVLSGFDNSPQNMISGTCTVLGSVICQMITAGVAGVAYLPICTITTSEGQTLILPEPQTGVLWISA